MNCAVCHDHKFDPIAQREFYEMSAYFNNTTQAVMDGNIKDTPPVLTVPLPQDRTRWDAIEPELPPSSSRSNSGAARLGRTSTVGWRTPSRRTWRPPSPPTV